MSTSLEGRLADAQAEGLQANLERWLGFVRHQSGDLVELQALQVRTRPGFNETRHARVTSVANAVAMATLGEKQLWCTGLYVIANRLAPAVEAREPLNEWLVTPKGGATTAADVTARTVLFIDVDPQRVSGVSATDEEMSAAGEVATQLFHSLADELGGDDALGFGHSGNGRGVFVALADLPEADASPLIASIVRDWAPRFDIAKVHVDGTVTDAKRLVPLFGTMKRKGIDRKDRPHRRTAFVGPKRVEPLTLAQLRALQLRLVGEPPPKRKVIADRSEVRPITGDRGGDVLVPETLTASVPENLAGPR